MRPSESKDGHGTRQRSALRIIAIVTMLLSLAVLTATAYRTYTQYHPGGRYDASVGGMADFHNGAYYPAKAMAQGLSPYGKQFAEEFPVPRSAPAYSPAIIAIHIPMTWLPLPYADILYFLISVLLLATSVHCVVREWQRKRNSLSPSSYFFPSRYWALFGLLFLAVLLSRGGHTTLLNGYFTPIIVLGVLMALSYADDRPLLGALGVFLAAGKPTFAFPLGLVLLARGNWKSLGLGVAFSVLGALLAAGYLAAFDSWSGLIASVRQGQEMHMADPREFPVNTWTRVDLTAIVSKWLGADPSELTQLILMLPLMVPPCLALWRLRVQGDSQGSTSLSGTIAILAILVTLYHHVYDTLLLIGPLAMIIGSFSLFINNPSLPADPPEHAAPAGPAPSNHPLKLWGYPISSNLLLLAILILGIMPWWNYLSSEIFLIRIGESGLLNKVLTSLNAVALTLSLSLAIVLAYRKPASDSLAIAD